MKSRIGLLAGFLSVFLSANLPADVVSDLWKDVDSFSRIQVEQQIVASYPYSGCFQDASEANAIPVIVLLGVAKGESAFDKDAVSRSRRTGKEIAHGIMQIKWPETARDLGFKNKEDLYDPCRNIEAGARYLRWLLDRYGGSYGYALAAYNYGPGRIYLDRSVPSGARWYVRYVLDKMISIQDGLHQHLESMPFYYFNTYFRATRFQNYVSRSAKIVDAQIEVQKLSSDIFAVQIEAPNPAVLQLTLAAIQRSTGLEPMKRRPTDGKH